MVGKEGRQKARHVPITLRGGLFVLVEGRALNDLAERRNVFTELGLYSLISSCSGVWGLKN